MKEYTCVSKEHQIEYIIEKSRFIATASPCSTEEEAQKLITHISKKYWDATHNCLAYCLGPNQEQQRSSDNGEPSGTAGKPILEVLKKQNITNTLIVVTRYFGGIKLGAGGLIRAYAHSAATVLNEAPKEKHAPRQIVEITIDYSYYNILDTYLKEENYYIIPDFGAQITLTIYSDLSRVDMLQKKLRNLTNGNIQIILRNIEIVSIPLL